MARARGKGNLQLGLPEKAIIDLEEVAPKVGRDINQRGLTANTIAAWAVQYVLSLDLKQQLKAIKEGIRQEQKYLDLNPGIIVPSEESNGSGAFGSATKGTVHSLPSRIGGRGKQRTVEHTPSTGVLS